MFAYVKFVSDGVKKVVPIEYIKKFDKDKPNDIKKVKFDDGYYYKAQILVVGNTEEEVYTNINEKRPHIPRLTTLTLDEATSEATSDDDDVKANLAKRQKQKKSVKKTEKNIALMQECLKNVMPVTESETLETLKNEIMELKAKEKKHVEKIEKLQLLNYSLQEEVIKAIKELQLIKTDFPDQREVLQEPLKPGDRKKGSVHLGRDVWLPAHIYDSICAGTNGKKNKQKDNIFIKELAIALFGRHVLMRSSVTGMKCNRLNTPAKEKLDATKVMAIHDILTYRMTERGESQDTILQLKSSVNSIIAEKIHDLTRPARQPRKTKKSNNDAPDNVATIIAEETYQEMGKNGDEEILDIDLSDIPVVLI